MKTEIFPKIGDELGRLSDGAQFRVSELTQNEQTGRLHATLVAASGGSELLLPCPEVRRDYELLSSQGFSGP